MTIDKSSIYGPVHHSHANIGLAWQGLIQQHYGITLPHAPPPWLVELMLVAFKVHRSARVFHPDNYGDLRTYVGFAEHAQSCPGQEYVFPEGSKVCGPGYEVPIPGLTGKSPEQAREFARRYNSDDPFAGFKVAQTEQRAKFAATDGMTGDFK